MTPVATLPSCGAPPHHSLTADADKHLTTPVLSLWSSGKWAQQQNLPQRVALNISSLRGKFVIILVILTGIIPLFRWDGKLLGDLKRT